MDHRVAQILRAGIAPAMPIVSALARTFGLYTIVEEGRAHVYVTPAESTNRRSTMVLPSVSPASPARPHRRWSATPPR